MALATPVSRLPTPWSAVDVNGIKTRAIPELMMRSEGSTWLTYEVSGVI